MKKFTAFLSALLVSLSLVFTACGSTKPAAQKSGSQKQHKSDPAGGEESALL